MIILQNGLNIKSYAIQFSQMTGSPGSNLMCLTNVIYAVWKPKILTTFSTSVLYHSGSGLKLNNIYS